MHFEIKNVLIYSTVISVRAIFLISNYLVVYLNYTKAHHSVYETTTFVVVLYWKNEACE